MAGGLSTIAFLLPEAQLDMAGLARRLRRRFPEARVQLHGRRVSMWWGEWKQTLSLHTDEMPVEECREMASGHPDDPTWRRVAGAVGRVEVQADVDPEDRYYNEWLLLSEFLSSIPGVLAYDPTLGEWLGQSATGSG
jgi:hypothetical protein